MEQSFIWTWMAAHYISWNVRSCESLRWRLEINWNLTVGIIVFAASPSKILFSRRNWRQRSKKISLVLTLQKGFIHFTSNFVYLWFYLKYICFPVAASIDKKSMKDREMFLKKMVLYSMMTLWKVMEIYSRLGGSWLNFVFSNPLPLQNRISLRIF